MSLSIYQASAPVFLRGLAVLSALLTKGEAHVTETGGDPADLLAARLAPDMHALPAQVQRACDASKLCISRLAAIDGPVFEDTEVTIADLQKRIADTMAWIGSVPPEAFDGAEERAVHLKAGSFERTFTGQDYLLSFALPNFYFHVTTTYALLRAAGVPIGKRDFLGG